MPLSRNLPCLCGSGRKAKGCCAPHLDGTPAATAEALMRSRWTAYACGDAAHIMRTTHPDSPHYDPDPRRWLRDIRTFCADVRFVELRVLSAVEADDSAVVAFHAGLRRAGEDASFSERSRFRKVAGVWKYLDGEG